MMAGLFDKQAKIYSNARPTYPSEWYWKLASLTAHHSLAWDVGTGNGQAALGVAEHYEQVIATNVSEEQLKLTSNPSSAGSSPTYPGTFHFLLISVGLGSEGQLLELNMPKEVAFEAFLKILRSWSAVNTALEEQGLDLLSERVVKELESAWGGSKLVRKVICKVYMPVEKVKL